MGFLDRWRNTDSLPEPALVPEVLPVVGGDATADHRKVLEQSSNREWSTADLPPAVYASVRPYPEPKASLFGRSPQGIEDLPWQRKLRDMYREGPGMVGDIVDLPRDVMRLVTWHVERREPASNEWTRSNNANMTALLNDVQGETKSFEQLMADVVFHEGLTGHMVLINRQLPTGRWVYDVRAPSNVESRNGITTVKAWPTATAADPSGWYQVPTSQTAYIWAGDPEWPGAPWTRIARVINDLDRVNLVDRLVDRTLRRRLVTPPVLWTQSDTQGVAPKWASGLNEHVVSSAADARDSSPESLGYFMIGSTADRPAVLLDYSPEIASSDLEVQDRAIANVARASGIPQLLLTEGPGAGNHWGDYVINDYFADFTMWPRAAFAASAMTSAVLRPWMRVLPGFESFAPEDWRIWFDLTAVQTRTDTSALVLQLGERGIATRTAQARVAGLSDSDIVPLPPGMSEYEYNAIRLGVAKNEPDAADEPVPEPPQGKQTRPTRYETPATEPVVAAEFDAIVAGLDADLML